MTFKEMSPVVSMREQLGHEVGPVVLINVFTVDPAHADALIEAWAGDAAFFKRRPGFISTQLHRGIAGSGVFVNYAVWESVERFRDAFAQPEFQTNRGLSAEHDRITAPVSEDRRPGDVRRIA